MNITHQRSPIREVVAYLSLTYGLALTIALALPDAGINRLLSVLVPTVTVTILTFTYFKKGERRSLWASLGLRRLGLKTWLPDVIQRVFRMRRSHERLVS